MCVVCNFQPLPKVISFFLESSVKLSQLKYTLAENQGFISIDVVHIGMSDRSVNVKLLLENQTGSSVAIGKQMILISQHIFW